MIVLIYYLIKKKELGGTGLGMIAATIDALAFVIVWVIWRAA